MIAARRCLSTIVLLLAVAARARGATAADEAGNDSAAMTPATPTVEVTVVGTPTDLQRVRSLFGTGGLAGATPIWVRVARFDPLDILREHHSSRAQRALRCWVDMSSLGRARLFFAAGSGERFLVRVIAVSPRADEMDRQALAEVLEQSVSALLDDEQAGLDREQAQALLESRWRSETPPPAPRASVPILEVRSTRSTFHLNLAAFYAGQALRFSRPDGNAVTLVHGPGLSLATSIEHSTRQWGLWASAQLQLPHRELANDVGFEFQTIATRAGLELQQTIGDGAVDRPRGIFRLVLRVGAGLDFVRLAPLPGVVDTSTTLTGARWSNSLVVTAAVGAGLQLGRRMRLGITLFADVLPTSVHYDLAAEGQITPVFSAARVRPGLALELAAAVL